MIFKDGKTFSAYVRSKLHSGYITIVLAALDISLKTLVPDSPKEGRDDRYHVLKYPLIQC